LGVRSDPLLLAPIAAEGIGYVTHPYANKRPRPWEARWEEDFGIAAAKYPVVATAFGGFDGPDANGDAYGPAIIKYLEGKGIGWMVWCFDPEWGPTLLGNWEYKLTPSGEFAKKAMMGGREVGREFYSLSRQDGFDASREFGLGHAGGPVHAYDTLPID